MISRKFVLHFPKNLVDRPIICKLVKDYNLEFNILKAFVTPEEEGSLVIELIGKENFLKKGIDYLKKCGVKVQHLSKDVRRNEEKCTHCGLCIPICPTGAFKYEKGTYYVLFDREKCIACELCIKICPPRAMELHI